MSRIKNIRNEPIAIISDDLTGANEIGLVLAEHLKSNLVLASVTSTSGLDVLIEDYAGVAVNLNTRDCSGNTAQHLISEVLQNNPELHNRLVYKKIDSTLRGNLIEELEAVLDNNFADVIYFVPASPQTNRFTVGGYHLVGNRPIALTEFAGELAAAVTSYLPDLLGRCLKYNVQSITLRQLAAGYQSVNQLTLDFYRAGFRIIVCDTISQQDLWVIGDAVLNSCLKILPVGSSALFKEFFTPGTVPCKEPCMIICGSLNGQSRNQAQKLIDSETACDIRINLDGALSAQRDSEIERIVQLATNFYKEKRDLLIQTPELSFSANLKAGVIRSTSIQSSIARLLGIIVARLLEKIKISGLILTRGSTAAEVINRLGGKGIVLVKELSPFVAVGRLADGPFGGLRVVTKGGGVGDPDILVRAVHYLRYSR